MSIVSNLLTSSSVADTIRKLICSSEKLIPSSSVFRIRGSAAVAICCSVSWTGSAQLVLSCWPYRVIMFCLAFFYMVCEFIYSINNIYRNIIESLHHRRDLFSRLHCHFFRKHHINDISWCCDVIFGAFTGFEPVFFGAAPFSTMITAMITVISPIRTRWIVLFLRPDITLLRDFFLLPAFFNAKPPIDWNICSPVHHFPVSAEMPGKIISLCHYRISRMLL